MTIPVLLKLGAGVCWALTVTASTVSPAPTSQSRNCFGKIKRKG